MTRSGDYPQLIPRSVRILDKAIAGTLGDNNRRADGGCGLIARIRSATPGVFSGRLWRGHAIWVTSCTVLKNTQNDSMPRLMISADFAIGLLFRRYPTRLASGD
jgi:hypothetical protein